MSALAATDPLQRVLAHRGVTHALWFGPLVGVLAGWLLARTTSPPRARVGTWIVLLMATLLSHPLLDVCTHYGTQLLSPFSTERFAVPALPIIEPFYSGLLVLGLVAMLLFARAGRGAAVVAGGVASLVVSSAYVFYGWRLNEAAVDYARKDLATSHAEVAIVEAFPTLLQLHLRRVVARTASEDLVGFVSMARPCPIVWARRPRDDSPLVQTLRATEEGRIFEWFATGLTVAYSDARRVFVSDLRYGLKTDVLRGHWRLEADIDRTGAIGRPRFIQSPRPTASAANVRALFRNAYPRSCAERSGALDS